MNNLSLTPKRRATWQFIADYSAQHGYSPTVQEVADHFGLQSLASANKRISALVKAGVAVREGTRARNLRLIYVPTSGLLRLDQALRTAGPEGRVKLGDKVYETTAYFGYKLVLAVGWEVV